MEIAGKRVVDREARDGGFILGRGMTMNRSILDAWPVFIAAVLIVIGIWAEICEQGQWERFAEEHHCKVVWRTSSNTGVGVGPISTGNGIGVGVITTVTPGKTGYICDDGVTYWR